MQNLSLNNRKIEGDCDTIISKASLQTRSNFDYSKLQGTDAAE